MKLYLCKVYCGASHDPTTKTMKVLSTVLLFFCATLAHAQWELLNPIKNTSEYEDIVLVNDLVGYAADRPTGTIIATEDGGNTWERRQHLMGNLPLALHMWDEERGVAVGQFGSVYRTTDGFRTVTTSSTGAQANNCVFFVNDTLGWIGKQDGKIYRSTNGGETWSLMASGQSTTNYITAIHFVDTEIGYASCYGGGKVLKSVDGGLTWTSVAPEPLVFIYDLHFSDALTGVAVGSAGRVIRTTDGGDTWEFITSNTTYTMVTLAVQGNRMVAGGWWGRAIHSTDGGLTWTEQQVGMEHMSVALTPSGYGLMGGIGRILRTTDFGTNWQLFQEGLSSATINKLSFVGLTGITTNALRTTDGGATWTDSGAGGGLGVHINANGSGSRGGGSGTFARTTDLFETYEPVFTGPNMAIRCTWSLNASTHIVGGGAVNGGIYRTTNSGNTWTRVLDIGNITISDLWFVDELQGYAVGEYGDGYRTTDGGLTWSTMGGGGGHTVFFIDEEYGWTRVGRTTDGGETWEMMGGTNINTRSIFFTDRETGYAVSPTGQVERSLDGGLTWDFLLPPLTQSSAQDGAYVDGYIVVGGALGDIHRARVGCSSTPWVPQVTTEGNQLCTPNSGTIQWYRNGEPIDGGTEPCIDAAVPGDYYVQVVDELGCSSAPSVVITTDCPTIAGPVVEQNGDVLCTATDGAAQWFFNGDPLAGGTTSCITATNPGLYHVVVTDGNGCASAPSATIEVFCQPYPGPTIALDGEWLCSDDVSVALQWFLNGAPTDHGDFACIIPDLPGSYHAVIIDAYGCESDPSNTVLILSTGVATNAGATIQVFPNPVADMLHFTFPAATDAYLQVVDALGHTVHEQLITGHAVNLSVATWIPGTYWLRLITAEGVRVVTVVRE